MSGDEKWCVVTGGRGFAARHLVQMLIRYDVFRVRIADLGSTVDLEPSEENGILAEALSTGRAQYVSLDLRSKSQVLQALQGAEVVFHMAAPNSSINNYKLHHSVNVEGTQNVIDACTELKVKRLIYTSSPSVVFDGIHGIVDGDESLPYPPKHNDFYSATKAQGEELVIKANGVKGLLTCCIRPSSIFGSGDRLLVPSLVVAARAGKSKFIIGDGNNIYDFTYVENVAHAHICAERALASEGRVAEKAAGQAYFITNMEPIKFWEFVSLILEGLGYERPRIKIPAFVVMPIAQMVELTYKLLGPYGMKVPQLTPSRIRLLSCTRSFKCLKAQDRIGYTPIVSLQLAEHPTFEPVIRMLFVLYSNTECVVKLISLIDEHVGIKKEGLKRTIEAYPHLRAEQRPKREGPSKVSIYLGSGRVADTLLWKDKKQTLKALIVLIAIYYNFIVPESTIITMLSKVLLVASVFVFTHACLPEKILGYKIEKLQSSHFRLSEETSQQIAKSLASSWNASVKTLKSLAKGYDGILFLKVVLTLLVLSLLGAFSLQNLYVIGVPAAFIVFYVYEEEEQEIDDMVLEALSRGCKLKSDVVKKFCTSKKIE